MKACSLCPPPSPQLAQEALLLTSPTPTPPQTRSPVLPNGSKKGHELFAYLSKLAREAEGKRCTGEEMGDLEDRHHPVHSLLPGRPHQTGRDEFTVSETPELFLT